MASRSLKTPAVATRGPGRPKGRNGKGRNIYLGDALWQDAMTLAAVRDNATGPSNLIEKLLTQEVEEVVAGKRSDHFSQLARVAILRNRKNRKPSDQIAA